MMSMNGDEGINREMSLLNAVTQALQTLDRTQKDLNQIRNLLEPLILEIQENQESSHSHLNGHPKTPTSEDPFPSSPNLSNVRPLFSNHSGSSSPRHSNQGLPNHPLSPKSPRVPFAYNPTTPSPRNSTFVSTPTQSQSQNWRRSQISSQLSFLEFESSSSGSGSTAKVPFLRRSFSDIQTPKTDSLPLRRSSNEEGMNGKDENLTDSSHFSLPQSLSSVIGSRSDESKVEFTNTEELVLSKGSEKRIDPPTASESMPTSPSSTRKPPPAPLDLAGYSQILNSVSRKEEPSPQPLQSGGFKVHRSSDGKVSRISDASPGLVCQEEVKSAERWLQEEADYDEGIERFSTSTPQITSPLHHDFTSLSIILEERSNLSRDSSAILERSQSRASNAASGSFLDLSQPESLDAITNELISIINSHQGTSERALAPAPRSPSPMISRELKNQESMREDILGSGIEQEESWRMPGSLDQTSPPLELSSISRDSPNSGFQELNSSRPSSTATYHTSQSHSKGSDSEDSSESSADHQRESNESKLKRPVQLTRLTSAKELEWKAVVGSDHSERIVKAKEKEIFTRRPSVPDALLLSSLSSHLGEKRPRRSSCSSDYPATSSHDTPSSAYPSITNFNDLNQPRRESNTSSSNTTRGVSHSRQASKETWIVDTTDSEEVPNHLLTIPTQSNKSTFFRSNSNWLGGLEADDSSMSDIGGGNRDELEKISHTFKKFELENPKFKSSSSTIRRTPSSKSGTLQPRDSSLSRQREVSSSSTSQPPTTPTDSSHSCRGVQDQALAPTEDLSPSLPRSTTPGLLFSPITARDPVTQESAEEEGTHGSGFCLSKSSFQNLSSRAASPLGKRSFSPNPEILNSTGRERPASGRYSRRSMGDGLRSPSARRSWIARALKTSEDGYGLKTPEEKNEKEGEPKENFMDNLFARARSPSSRSPTPLSIRSRRQSSTSLGRLKKLFNSPAKSEVENQEDLPLSPVSPRATTPTLSTIFLIGRDQSSKIEVNPSSGSKEANYSKDDIALSPVEEPGSLKHSRSLSNVVKHSRSWFDSGKKVPNRVENPPKREDSIQLQSNRPVPKGTSSASPVMTRSSSELLNFSSSSTSLRDVSVLAYRGEDETRDLKHSRSDRNQNLDNLHSFLVSQDQNHTPLTPPTRRRKLHLDNSSPEPSKIDLGPEIPQNSSNLLSIDFGTRPSSFVQHNEFSI